MKFLIFVALVAFCQADSERDAIKLAADSPQKLQALFSQFRADNHRVYKSPVEARFRMGIFRNFVKEAAKINDEQEDMEVGITFFADLTEEEKRAWHGANITVPEMDDAPMEEEDEMAPMWGSSVSHKRHYGAVKSQGRCGSCWAFASTGCVEGWQSKLTGRYTSLSDKMTLDCSGAGSCSGGYHTSAMSWIARTNNLASSASYPYSARKGSCQRKPSAMTIRVSRTWTVRGSSAMAGALNNGPVIFFLYNFHGVAVEGYKGGILSSSSEQNGPMAMNHVVVGTGYTSSTWEMRNSWGSWWGQGGYFTKRRTDRQVASNVVTMSASRAGEEVEE